VRGCPMSYFGLVYIGMSGVSCYRAGPLGGPLHVLDSRFAGDGLSWLYSNPILYEDSMRRLSLLLTFGLAGPALASDHGEAPIAGADPAADIADFYAWHTDDGKIVAVVTFASGAAATYDADVLYGVHIDNDLDNVSDIDIWARFGANADGEWGLQVTNLPGSSGVIEGAVEMALVDGDTSAWAGLSDDPFFFDFAGFQDTLASGAISFDPTRDSFAGLNVSTIVLEMSTDVATVDSSPVQMWTTTGRK
jgi:hypothetical protein